MKKHVLPFLIISFFVFLPKANASYGDLRYEVTDLIISGNTITFKGWAFIHRTNNYIRVYRNIGDYEIIGDNAYNKNDIIKDYGGQSIYMKAYANGTEITTSSNNENREKINYNFYEMQHYQRYNFGNTESEFRNDYNNSYHNLGNDDEDYSDCYYQDIDYEISFDVQNWKTDYPNQNISFKIFVTNTDFQNKEHNPNAVVSSDVAVDKSVTSGILENDNMKINVESLSSKVKAIVEKGRPKNINNFDEIYNNIIQTYIHTGADYTLCGSQPDNTVKGKNIFGISANKKCVCVNETPQHNIYEKNFEPGSSCNAGVWSSWYVPIGRLSIQVKEDKKCPVVNPGPNNTTCNGSGIFKSDCDKLTVGSSTVSIKQQGILTNILTPLEVYEGGPFHLGIIYYNTISWSCESSSCGSDVTTAMKKKLIGEADKNKINDFENQIKIDNVIFNGKDPHINFVKHCEQRGSFEAGQTLTTVCTFFLPKSKLEPYKGKVIYGDGIDNGINNKYYTDIGFDGYYKIRFKISGMNIIKNTVAKSDSEKHALGIAWTGDWSSTIDNCMINVYSRLYKKPTGTSGSGSSSGSSSSSSLEYKFIYRPIDVYNPFPNRYAGVNWFEWYHGDSYNREKLRNSYNNNPDYIIELNSEKIKNIRNYNNTRNYLDWTGIDEFIKTYTGGSN